jgi:hypothetical protein
MFMMRVELHYRDGRVELASIEAGSPSEAKEIALRDPNVVLVFFLRVESRVPESI